jgi:hypothetical protein
MMMSEQIIKELVSKIRAMPDVIIDYPQIPKPFKYSYTVRPPKAWSKELIENQLGIGLPLEIQALWNNSSELRIYEDVNYGQGGLVIYGPQNLVSLHREKAGQKQWEGRFRQGDLVMGELIGDDELVLLRCDPEQEDFGDVIIALPIEARTQWPTVESSLTTFLEKFLESPAEKYWERRKD